MESEVYTFILAFFEGFALIISPCIWSILPIILAGSLIGTRKRALGIIVGFALTFVFSALFARQFVNVTGVDLNLVRHIAYCLLFLLSLILMFDFLNKQFTLLTEKLISPWSGFRATATGFWNGVLLGMVVALIWTPCAGPILATIIVQVVIQKTTVATFFTLLAFAIGATLPMLIIVFYGFVLKEGLHFFKHNAKHIRKVLGVMILLNLVYMISLEEGYLPNSNLKKLTSTKVSQLQEGLWKPYLAPEISGIELWLNGNPQKLKNLQGKVVLVDFWTYSCINCIRTLPYLKNWYEQYHDKGLVIIGIHSPEFDFEEKVENVKDAVKRYGIKYPVALDNAFVTWRLFANHYWPAHYLIDPKGQVVYQHFGEGDYDVTENNIRYLLGVNQLKNTPKGIDTQGIVSLFQRLTPETYLGYVRADSELSPYLYRDKVFDYQSNKAPKLNAWDLKGSWKVNPEHITATAKNASLKLHFRASKVYAVMGSSTQNTIVVNIFLNGKPLKQKLNVNKHSLYELIAQPGVEDGILEIFSDSPGLEVYTFTFGGV